MGTMGVHTVGDHGALYDGTEETLALGKAKALETTADGVNQAKPSSLPCKVRVDLVVVDEVSDVLNDLIGVWANGRLAKVGRHGARCGRDRRERAERSAGERGRWGDAGGSV